MSHNELSEITYQGNTYTLIDNTEFGPNETANSIYHFINCAEPRIIDASCVHEVMVSAESFAAAIEEFHHTYRVQHGVPHTVEYIGNDLRAKTADPHLISK
ncbi:hypothetical protein ST201phi2-1p097 [Pseudomonas phage 201phi2-1]|uniref:Uncharacterized protein n=1 Tax=Pseudomonas phage 201phi2-1 TaxID=198110 RepID=B3FIW1_BP201|nr:hypothetical protein ST201phi2-1p097 [Pseudomonas phage 201phi2-1]ABY62930.1 hypothetical protein 201phi2-1p097 [Pseudomonas phage 201phi2-1]